jgi:hypothetical protein
MSTGSMNFKKGHRIKVYKKGGKVSKW